MTQITYLQAYRMFFQCQVLKAKYIVVLRRSLLYEKLCTQCTLRNSYLAEVIGLKEPSV